MYMWSGKTFLRKCRQVIFKNIFLTSPTDKKKEKQINYECLI